MHFAPADPALALGFPSQRGEILLRERSLRNRAVPRLAAWSLGAGIVATVGANLAHGVGPVGALVSAWPVLALVGSFELLMMLIRTRRGTQPGLAEDAPQYPAAPPVVQEVPSELTFTSTLEQIVRAPRGGPKPARNRPGTQHRSPQSQAHHRPSGRMANSGWERWQDA